MTQQPPSSGSSELASRLRGVRVGLRPDLDASRHVFRGEVSYVLRDRLTFQSHRFSVDDYQIVIEIDETRSLGDIFEQLVAREVLQADDEERFYSFILQLHQRGLLSLPIADDKLLYRRYKAKQKARVKQRAMGFLFLQVPLIDPSAFLDRTIHLARPLFTRWCFALWCVLMFAAGSVCILRAHDLARPLDELLATQNLAVMWVTLILLKICHEFGHAYACRSFGGHVPEMGAFFIAGTPCAYVDATSSWGFASRWQRIAVALAGMYVELMIAAVAVFVWAFSTDAMVRSVAYNVIFLAGVTTLLFNANPLMRYDGYYVFSDLIQIPNLRSRATKAVQDWLKRWIVGVQSIPLPKDRSLQATLLGYGTAAGLYRFTVLLGIATIVAIKLPIVGLVIAGGFLLSVIVGPFIRTSRYLLFARETGPVRVRACVVGALAMVALPAMILGIPVHWPVYAPAVTEHVQETTLRASSPAFLEDLRVRLGESVPPGATVAALENPDLVQAAFEAKAHLKASELRYAAFEAAVPWRAVREHSAMESLSEVHDRYKVLLDELNVRSQEGGTVVECLERNQLGRFLQRGDAIATIAGDELILRLLLNERQFAAAQVRVGDRIRFRPRSRPTETIEAEVCCVEPAGTRAISTLSSEHVGRDGVQVDAQGNAAQPYFEIQARLRDVDHRMLARGSTGMARFESQIGEPLGLHIYRAIARFVNSLQAG